MDARSAVSALDGDKVVLRAGPNAGKRGTIAAVQRDGTLLVQLDEGGTHAEMRLADVRNFSAAARQAWKTSPSRRVGRPPGRSRTRISVTLRIDATLWERFRSLESRNLVGGRSEFIELALAEAIHRAEERTR